MLGRIASLVAKGSYSPNIKVPIKSFKATRRTISTIASARSTTTSFAKWTSQTRYSKPISIIKITQRNHAGCGMPHDGDEVPGHGMERELRAHLNVTDLKIVDTSGNGSFYYVEVESPDFVGKSMLACHKMVQSIISTQIQNIHGLQIKTRAPKPAQ